MNSFIEFRQRIMQKTHNRLVYLQDKFKGVPTNKMSDKVVDEMTGIELVLFILKHEPAEEMSRKKQVAVSTSQSENWYREALSIWLQQHPEVGVDPNNNAGLYRFALEFFVREIVLNPKNNTMAYAELLHKMNQLNAVDPVLKDINSQLDTKIEDIKELLSFLTSMEYVANMTVFGPARQLDQSLMEKIRSEFDNGSKFSQDFNQYKMIRQADKLTNQNHYLRE